MGENSGDKPLTRLEKILLEEHLKKNVFKEAKALFQQNKQLNDRIVRSKEWKFFVGVKAKWIEGNISFSGQIKSRQKEQNKTPKKWYKKVILWLFVLLVFCFYGKVLLDNGATWK